MESQMPIKKKKKDLDKKEQSQRSYPSWDQDQLVSCKHWGTLILIKRHTHTHTHFQQMCQNISREINIFKMLWDQPDNKIEKKSNTHNLAKK